MYLVILEVLFSGEEENKYIELLIWRDLVKLICIFWVGCVIINLQKSLDLFEDFNIFVRFCIMYFN